MAADLFIGPATRVTEDVRDKRRRVRLWWRLPDGSETAPRDIVWPDDFVAHLTDGEIEELARDLAPRLARKLDDVDRLVRERPQGER